MYLMLTHNQTTFLTILFIGDKRFWGNLWWIVNSEYPAKEVCLGGLRVGRNYVCCLVIVFIFIGLGRAKSWVSSKSYYGEGQNTKGRRTFLWGELTPLDTMIIVVNFYIKLKTNFATYLIEDNTSPMFVFIYLDCISRYFQAREGASWNKGLILVLVTRDLTTEEE